MLFFPPFPTISRHFPRFPGPPHPPGKGSARRSVAAFLRVVARHGAAMARHGRPPSPAPATRPVGFSPATFHATWFFPVPPATPGRATPSPANGFFTKHESRVTNHGLYAFLPTISRYFPRFPGPPPPWERVRAPFGRCFPARCGAAWGGYGAAWAATVPRAGNTACWVFTSHESRNMFSSCPPATPRRAAPSPANGFFTNHESRNTNHGLYAFLAAFLRVVERHGAAMARHGRHIVPEPAVRAPFALKSRQCAQNPASPRKMREVLRSPLLPSPSGLNPLRWTRMDTPLPPPRQNRPSFVVIRVHSW